MTVAPIPRDRHRIPLGVSIGLAVAILLDTLVQLCWKGSVGKAPEEASAMETLRIVAVQPLTYVLLALFVAQFVNWMTVLGKTDLSFAQPITAISYVLTCLGSAAFFGDQLPPLRCVGIGLILAGVWLVTRTGHLTVPKTVSDTVEPIVEQLGGAVR